MALQREEAEYNGSAEITTRKERIQRFSGKYNEKRPNTSVQQKIQREKAEYNGSARNTTRKERIQRFSEKYHEKRRDTTVQLQIQRKEIDHIASPQQKINNEENQQKDPSHTQARAYPKFISSAAFETVGNV